MTTEIDNFKILAEAHKDDFFFKLSGGRLYVKFKDELDFVVSTVDGMYTHDTLELFGVKTLSYTNDAGIVITPDTLGLLSDEQLFSKFLRRLPEEGELDTFSAFRTAAAKAFRESDLAQEYLKTVDFDVLHAFDCCANDDWLRDNGAEWLLCDDISSKSMRRFLIDYPILAAVACNDDELFDAIKDATSIEDGYERILKRIETFGFPDTHESRIGPISREAIEHICGLRFDVSAPRVVQYDEEIAATWVSDAFALAFRLPLSSFPKDAEEFQKVGAWASIFKDLAKNGEDYDTEDVLNSGYGMGITFSDEEAFKVMSGNLGDGLLSSLPVRAENDLRYLGWYAFKLAGYENEVRDAISLNEPFDVLSTIDPNFAESFERPMPDELTPLRKVRSNEKDYALILKNDILVRGFDTVWEDAVLFSQEVRRSPSPSI